LLADGDIGSADALGVDDGLVPAEPEEKILDADTDEERSLAETLADDLVEVEDDAIEDTIADGLPDADADAEDHATLLGTEYEAEGVACGDCHLLVDRGHSHSLCVSVTCAPVVCGGPERLAVSGPNSLIK
jgi:hypothetical protein